MAENPVCPETGAPMRRDARPMTLNYKGQSITFDMPGWYSDASAETLHSDEDMKISDRALNRLKAAKEGLPLLYADLTIAMPPVATTTSTAFMRALVNSIDGAGMT